jgi:hypothetical protein
MGTTVGAYAYLLFERLDDCACAVGWLKINFWISLFRNISGPCFRQGFDQWAGS